MHTITILHAPGCTGAPKAIEEARALASEREDVTVEEVRVTDTATALALGLRGSPTVLVDGADLEPETEMPLGSMG